MQSTHPRESLEIPPRSTYSAIHYLHPLFGKKILRDAYASGGIMHLKQKPCTENIKYIQIFLWDILMD